MTRVLPLPAPARTSRGPSPATTASRCDGFRSSRRCSSRADTTRLYPTRQIARDWPNRHAARPHRRVHARVFARFGATALAQRLPQNDPAMKTKKILIVEDNEVVQDILRQFFEPRYTVQIASNGSQALSAIVRGTPDVALLDI